ncbi:MAG: hypothetical protein EXS09_19140 [Gemmataceae bacterium]|nr:hypothetical protein [Gemmataceae bacterium]
MSNLVHLTLCSTLLAVSVLAGLAGCAREQGKPEVDLATVTTKSVAIESHGHSSIGPHLGPLAEWGKNEYHAEFTVDQASKQVVVYILDEKAKAAPSINRAKITNVTLSIKNVTPVVFVELKHDSQKSGNLGIAFVGMSERFAMSGAYVGTISGKIDGKPYSGEFSHKAHDEMPSAVGSDREQALYRTPGGIYTSKDIQANGDTVPSTKFKGKSWLHDDDLKVGDKICPVTKNKSETECAWIVDGKRYEFCCPPCLDKFVGWAKTQPEKVKNPKDYVYQGK